MDWLACIRKTVDLLEADLKSTISLQKISAEIGVSPFFLQKGFSFMTGYSVSEYIRNRRLYLAALELRGSDRKDYRHCQRC